MRKPYRLYFLCVHNRCRSQIAEAFAAHFGGDRVIAESAGIQPREIHPLTVEAIQESGIDILRYKSKRLNINTFFHSHMIIKLCEDIREHCPVVLYGVISEQWNIADPLSGVSDDVTITNIRKTRDEIQLKVRTLLQRLGVPDY